jgi:predicted Rossmann fold flavoprotein
MYDVVVIGGGAAGLMAAWTAGQQGSKTLLIEHTSKIGEKIRISGGGRCNFTNLHASPTNYLSQNPHFIKSALAGYTQFDFIKLIKSHNIAFHEKTLGQLFCDGSSKQIITMMTDLCQQNGVHIDIQRSVDQIFYDQNFILKTSKGIVQGKNLILATGGLSIPQIGASDFGYTLAKQFGHKIIPTRPALVPLIVKDTQRSYCTDLSGVSNPSRVTHKKGDFLENILFTHKGLSGPAILQISSYLEGFNDQEVRINLLPHLHLKELFKADKNSKQSIGNYLKAHLPNRLVDYLGGIYGNFDQPLTDAKMITLEKIAGSIHELVIPISGSEGYQKAEVTIGGVDTRELSSKTMESKKIPGLYFIGEVVDVTGWLGGYNFQWAWSSGYAAGIAAAQKKSV